jgi:hypothetical protein
MKKYIIKKWRFEIEMQNRNRRNEIRLEKMNDISDKERFVSFIVVDFRIEVETYLAGELHFFFRKFTEVVPRGFEEVGVHGFVLLELLEVYLVVVTFIRLLNYLLRLLLVLCQYLLSQSFICCLY